MLLLAGIALFYTLVVFNNLTDFDSNYEFVRHVLSMDSTFPGNHGMWRALPSPAIHLAFYLFDHCLGDRHDDPALVGRGQVCYARFSCRHVAFNAAKRVAVMALTLSLLMWLVAFHAVGGEWFLMWQSHTWNGQEEAFRKFAVVGLVLLILSAARHRDSAVTASVGQRSAARLRRNAYHASPDSDIGEIDIRNARMNLRRPWTADRRSRSA